MPLVRCPYCHKAVEESHYRAHEARHRTKKPDGQYTDYVTLPPEERLTDSLDGVPQVYIHRRCGAATGMPEEIIRSYLQDPYLYEADRTFCTGCHKHVPHRECVWVETGENMDDYMRKLRAAKPHLRRPLLRRIFVALVKPFL